MTKEELEYERIVKQIEELNEKMRKTKEIIDKERDEAVVKALHERNISREQGFKLAGLIGDPECFDEIMELEPRVKEVIKKRRRKVNEDIADKESEEKSYEK